MIRYFVSYSFSDYRGAGTGYCEIHRPDPISSMGDIAELTDLVRQQGVGNPVILSFCRFEDETPSPAGPLDSLVFDHIRELLEQHKQALTVDGIALQLNLPTKAVRRVVDAAVRLGRLTVTPGGYTLPGESR